MKIISVEVFDCEINRHYPDMVMFEPIFVRINTDEGISGIGEVGLWLRRKGWRRHCARPRPVRYWHEPVQC